MHPLCTLGSSTAECSWGAARAHGGAGQQNTKGEGQARPGQARSEQVRSGEARRGQARPGPDRAKKRAGQDALALGETAPQACGQMEELLLLLGGDAREVAKGGPSALPEVEMVDKAAAEDGERVELLAMCILVLARVGAGAGVGQRGRACRQGRGREQVAALGLELGGAVALVGGLLGGRGAELVGSKRGGRGRGEALKGERLHAGACRRRGRWWRGQQRAVAGEQGEGRAGRGQWCAGRCVAWRIVAGRGGASRGTAHRGGRSCAPGGGGNPWEASVGSPTGSTRPMGGSDAPASSRPTRKSQPTKAHQPPPAMAVVQSIGSH